MPRCATGDGDDNVFLLIEVRGPAARTQGDSGESTAGEERGYGLQAERIGAGPNGGEDAMGREGRGGEETSVCSGFGAGPSGGNKGTGEEGRGGDEASVPSR